VSVIAPRVLLDRLVFPESSRWRDGRQWFSDMFGHRVMTLHVDGRSDIVAEVKSIPSIILSSSRLDAGEARAVRTDANRL